MTVRADEITYIVLSELGDGAYWVCLRRLANPDWLQVVARFASKDRAEQYAHVENDLLGDDSDLRGDEFQGQPLIKLPPSGIPKLAKLPSLPAIPAPAPKAEPPVEPKPAPAAEVKTPPAEPPKPAPPVAAPAGAQPAPKPSIAAVPKPPPLPADEPTIVPRAKKQDSAPEKAGRLIEEAADLIRDCWPLLTQNYPNGPTPSQIALHTGVPEHRVRLALNHLREKDAAIGRDSSFTVTPAPPKREKSELSPQERKVFDALVSKASDGIAQLSKLEISNASGVPTGSLGAVLYGLEIKGAAIMVERGENGVASKYRILTDARAA